MKNAYVQSDSMFSACDRKITYMIAKYFLEVV